MSAADEMRRAMLELGEMFEPFREWGKGFRESLVRDGWSEDTAEQIAAEAVTGMIRKAMNS